MKNGKKENITKVHMNSIRKILGLDEKNFYFNQMEKWKVKEARQI